MDQQSKIQNPKSQIPRRFFIYGMGPGETAQGAGLARHALAAGHQVTMAVRVPQTLAFLDTLACPKTVLRHSAAVRAEIEQGGYDVVVFCNSKAFGEDPDFQNTPPSPRPFTCSLDSNWLFNHPTWYPHIQWLDSIFLTFPHRIFQYGLREGGGHYEIPAPLHAKIEPVGFIPSRAPLDPATRAGIRHDLGLRDHHRLIFSYFGRGATYQRRFFPRYVEIMDACYRACEGTLRVIHFGDEQPQAPWVLCAEDDLDRSRFYTWLAASDLVFQHHGLSTLMQAVAAQTPVIANIHRPRPGCRHAHAWELGPFEKAGVCALHFFDEPLDRLVDSMRGLLFPSPRRTAMIEAQQRHFVAGEGQALKAILDFRFWILTRTKRLTK